MAHDDHVSTGRCLRVLIVEDEFLIALELETLLAEMGHEVVGHASIGPQAVELFGSVEPDLALMDLHLAHGTCGAEAAAAIRARHADASIIFVSGSLRELKPAQISAICPIAMLDKPFREKDLMGALDTVRPQMHARAS